MSLIDANEQSTVIDVNQLSSDIEADFDDLSARDDEINLLNEKEITSSDALCNNSNSAIYRERYRDVVHALRQLNRKLGAEREQHAHQLLELNKQLDTLKNGTDNHSTSKSEGVALVNVVSDGEINTKDDSQLSMLTLLTERQHKKLRDLEKLMAKCKESLKAKNQQLKILKDSLLQVEKFKEHIDSIKNDLQDLRQTHETWTLSIAENKRVMHQEIESKNLEIDKLKTEIVDLQAQLKDSNNKSIQLKSNIQTLESRLVSTSAAHQKERESLSKELVSAKNNAIRQLQKSHDLQMERVKLDLERSIENLKLEILVKDEQIIRNAEKEQDLQEQKCSLKTDLDSIKARLSETQNELSALRIIKDDQTKEISQLKSKNELIEAQSEHHSVLETRNDILEKKNQELLLQAEELTKRLSSMEKTNVELEEKLRQSEQAMSEQGKDCPRCLELEVQKNQDAERYEQSSFELKTKLDLMTTANSDQEKVLQDLKKEYEKAVENYKSFKNEVDELTKRNHTMSLVIQENEAEMQNHQEHQKQLASTRQQLETVKRENCSLTSSLSQANTELCEKMDDLKKSQLDIDGLKKRLTAMEQEIISISQSSEALKKEKHLLVTDLASESKRRRDLEQQLVVSILAAMKNLDTPDTSPGSDKTYKSDVPNSIASNAEQHNLPDPVRLAEELSTLALDRSNAYMTSNQRLQAVLLDNTMMNEEIKRLKEELNALNKEKTNEVLVSLEEVERLRTENQALIHDQKAYDDQLSSLGDEIERLKSRIAEVDVNAPQKNDAITATDDDLIDQLELRKQEIEQLKLVLADREKAQQHATVDSAEVPDPTEFKYLKNIGKFLQQQY